MPSPSIYPPGVVNPTDPLPDITGTGPTTGGSVPGTVTVKNAAGMAPMLPAALKWLGALFLLWVVLTALTEHGDPNAKNIGRALAGLILLGALYYLGPDSPSGHPGAITNAKLLVQGSTSGGS
jgi:hypothetical protein